MAKFGRDKTQYWEAYFPPRNGVRPNLVDKRNFDNDTLYYIAKPKIANMIANKIESFTLNKKYFVIDITAGIGGNTLAFLDKKNCSAVMSFERDEKRSLYLRRNIMAYNFGDKSIVLNSEVTGTEDFADYQDSIFYFDPPWLPEDLKIDGDYKKYYIRKGMKVGNLTLEEWLEKLKDVAYFVVIRVPDNYELGEVPGWTYEFENLGKDATMKALAEDGKMYMCFNNRKIKGASTSKFGGYIKQVSGFKMKLQSLDESLANRFESFRTYCNGLDFEEAKKNESCKTFLKYSFEDPEPYNEPVKVAGVTLPQNIVVKETTPDIPKAGPDDVNVTFDGRKVLPYEKQVWVFDDLPTPTEGIDLESAEWAAELQNFLYEVLSKFIKGKDGKPRKDIIDRLLSGDYMHIWIQAFTDESYKTDPRENYEYLETIGDRVLKYLFPKYLFKYFEKYDVVDDNKITTYNNKYMSKDFQPLIARGFKFPKWLRYSKYSIKITPDKEEDTYESFCGALHNIGEMEKPFMGVALVEKFVDFITQKMTFDPDERYGEYKRRTEQSFPKIGLSQKDSVFETINGTVGDYLCTVSISKEAVNKLKLLGITGVPQTNVIGQGRAKIKKSAQNIAWYNASIFLKSIGFDPEKAQELKEESAWNRIKDTETNLYNKVKIILSRNGIDIKDVVFESEATGQTYVKANDLVYMIQYKDNVRIKLSEGLGDSRYAASITAIKNYITKAKDL